MNFTECVILGLAVFVLAILIIGGFIEMRREAKLRKHSSIYMLVNKKKGEQKMKEDRGATEAKKYGIERSPEWPKVEKAHLEAHPTCAVCGQGADKVGLQVHHVFPFHYCIALGRPDLELDDRNLITLCESEKDKPSDDHHLLLGHLDDFQSSNLAVRKDAEKWAESKDYSENEIKGSAEWQAEEAARLKPLGQMSPGDKAGFIALMNKTYPKK